MHFDIFNIHFARVPDGVMKKNLIKAWIKASRPPFYIATLIPLTLGWILAAKGEPLVPEPVFPGQSGRFRRSHGNQSRQ